MNEPIRTKHRSRRLLFRWLPRLAIVFLASALLLEGFFRWVLFHDGAVARALVARVPILHQPQSYAFNKSADYWKLQFLLGDPDHRGKEATHDPLLGWRNRQVAPDTYAHANETELAGRRPVLVFGDSFAKCLTGPDACWEGLVERSDLADRFAVLNYAAAGYGVGQISLSCRMALPRFLEMDPVVIICVLVDDDLDRSVLDFRGWPKPVHRLDEAGRLVLVDEPLPATRAEYLEQNGVSIASYAWSFLVHATPLVPWRKRAAVRSHELLVRSVNHGLLQELVALLRADDVDFFFVAFHGKSFSKKRSQFQRRENFLLDTLEELGVPFVSSRRELETDVAQGANGWDDFFFDKGLKKNHYTPLGNEVVFRAIRSGLAGEFHAR